jgi:peptide methionine sulfoxide reductase MsrB
MEYNKLTPAEERVIIHKGTEMPFTGEYDKNKQTRMYVAAVVMHRYIIQR